MTNKEVLRDSLKISIGCYSPLMDKLSKNQINKIISKALKNDRFDMALMINGKMYMLEVVYMYELNEIDFVILSYNEYQNRYVL